MLPQKLFGFTDNYSDTQGDLTGYQLCHVDEKPWASILREKRLTLRMTQQEVADKAKIRLQQYQKFEYGQRKLSNSSMVLGLRICAILELDPYEFAFESDFDWMKKIR